MITRLTFEPSKRLHQPAEFRAIKIRGRKLGDAFFSLSVLANQRSTARLGLAIATRALGSSVARNRLKRITRESFRLNQHALPAVDITVSARAAARLAESKALWASLDRHWKNITQRW